MVVKPSVITHSSSSLAPQNTETTMDDKLTLEELFYLHSYPCTGNGDQERCARWTIRDIAKADTDQEFTHAEIKAYVEQRYGLI